MFRAYISLYFVISTFIYINKSIAANLSANLLLTGDKMYHLLNIFSISSSVLLTAPRMFDGKIL